MRTHRYWWVLAGFVASLAVTLQAQTVATGNPQNNVVSAVAVAQGLPPIAPADLPRLQTYWLASYRGVFIPFPSPPQIPGAAFFLLPNGAVLVDPGNDQVLSPKLLTGQLATSEALNSALAAEVAAVANLINQSQAQTQTAQLGGRTTMGFGRNGPLLPGGDSGGDIGIATNFPLFSINSNLLYLTLTNVANGLAYCGLGSATGQVYGILESSSLATPLDLWTAVAEVWPTDTNLTPFTVAAQNQDSMFLSAIDWTSVYTNGVPMWWSFYWYGDFTNTTDSAGNLLVSDFQNGTDPNVISFSVRLGNRHFNTPFAFGQYTVSAGTPSYEAVLVNDTDFIGARWKPYDGTVSIPLGATDGVYQVWLGLKGYATNATPTWIGTTVYLAQTAPVVTITNPVAGTVALPYIQVQGFANERLAGVTYDLSNALGVVTGQTGTVTGEFLDTNLLAFTTNYFRCVDVWLTNGLNVVTVHATDLAGNVGSTTISYTLDYSGKTNPPAIQLDWPAEGMQIGQSNMTVYGTLDDPTAAISLQVTDDAGDTQVIAGVVERDGHFWIQNVPLAGTTDVLTLTVQDVVSNTSTMNLTVYPANDAGLTMDPVPGDLWDSTATVSGTIADDSYAVTVNGVAAVNNGDGTWTADGVPVSGGNMAVFTAQAVTPEATTEVQAAAIKQAALKLAAATLSDDNMNGQNFFGYGYTDEIQTSWNWTAGRGGSWQQTDTIVLQPGSVPIATTWNNAPIRADGSVPYEISSDSAGDCWTNGFSGGPWQSDFPQEVGALAAIGQTPPGWWDVRSGDASWVLHAGNLDVSSGQNPDSLMVLSAMAMEEVQGSGAEGTGGIVSGPVEQGPEIDNTGQQEDTSYEMALVTQDGTERSSTVTTDRLLASVGNSVIQNKLKWVVAACSPPLDMSRTVVGIGENIHCYMVGGVAADWSVTGGGQVSPTNGPNTTFTAGFTPTNSTVHAKFLGQELKQDFSVIAPGSIIVVSNWDQPFGPVNTNGTITGAQTFYLVSVTPTNVDFSNVAFREHVSPNIIKWPCGLLETNMPGIGFPTITCSHMLKDCIATHPHISNIFDGTNYVDFSYPSTWTNQYLGDTSNWVDFATMNVTRKFRGSDKKAEVIYQGIPSINWQGPYLQ